MLIKRQKIVPILGLKTNVSQDDMSLFKALDKYGQILATYHVDGVNIDFTRTRKSCSKAYGRQKWATTSVGTGACLGLFELYDGSNRDHIVFTNGKVYYYDSAWSPTRLCDTASCAGSPVEFATGAMDFFTPIRYGAYLIFTDMGEHTPYKWRHGDTVLTKLISSGTEYKFKYLHLFQGRILGVYSADETDGDLLIRWTENLPNIVSGTSYASTDALYKPDNDPIVGVKDMGMNACFIYGENSISRLDYYASYSTPFGMTSMVLGQGAANHHSIVSTGDSHFFFNKNYGFCEYKGGSQFPYGGKPISEDIEDKIATISSNYYGHLIGKFIPHRNEICWAVPLDGAAVPSHLLYYHIIDKTWRLEDKIMRFLDNWVIFSSFTWNNLITALGGTGAKWEDAPAGAKWVDYITSQTEVVMQNTDGFLYYLGTDSDLGSDLDGYRTEPIMDFGDAHELDLLTEIWFKLSQYGDYSIDISYRGGDTEAELARASWIALGSVSCKSPDQAVLYCDQMNRLHQIKWGTDKASEPYSVNAIEFGYIPQARY